MTEGRGRPDARKRVLLLGGTGTIGQATARALVAAGHDVVAPVRQHPAAVSERLPGVTLRRADVTDPVALRADGLRGERFDAVVSCLASRTGAPADAWAIDHDAQQVALAAAQEAGIGQFVLLSAICVQKPLLEFQRAKLAFERALMASDLTWSIVRPTAFFKSLSGQLDRLRAGKPFLIFGDGTLTACKPISDDDLGRFIAGCLTDPDRRNRVLPIGGPGPAMTARAQGEALFAALGQEPRFKSVPVGMMDAIITGLSGLGRLVPKLQEKAELARIGRYYATESMLVLDPRTGRYDAAATPETGGDTLADFFQRLVRGEVAVERGDHAVF